MLRSIGRLAAVSVALIAAIAIAPAAAQGAYPGLNGKIIFQSERAGQPDIWVVDGDGGNPTNLTAGIDQFSQMPSFSADGKRIAFAVGGKVATMNADGSNLNVTNQDTSLFSGPIFTPDGGRIVFELQVGAGGPPDLFIMPADGSGTPQTLQTGQTPTSSETDPAFSPDGNRLAFSSNRGANFDNFLASGSGSGAVNFSSRPTFNLGNDFAPDASRLIWVNSNGPSSTLLVAPLSPIPAASTTIPATGLGAFSGPVFSPDGNRIAFVSSAAGGDADIVTTNLAGGNLVNVSDGETSNVASDTTPSWAPLTDSERALTLRYKKKRKRFKGALTAADPGCLDGATIKVERKRKGKFRKVARTETDGKGAFSVKKRKASGKFRALAPLDTRVGVANCLEATSPKLKRR